MSQQKQIEVFHEQFPSSIIILKEQLRAQKGSEVTEEELGMLADNELWSFFSTANRQDVNIAGVACVIEKASKASNIRNFGGLVNSILKKPWVHDRFAVGSELPQTTSTVTNDFEEAPEETPARTTKSKKRGSSGSKQKPVRLEGSVPVSVKDKVSRIASKVGKTQAELTGELIELGLPIWLDQINE